MSIHSEGGVTQPVSYKYKVFRPAVAFQETVHQTKQSLHLVIITSNRTQEHKCSAGSDPLTAPLCSGRPSSNQPLFHPPESHVYPRLLGVQLK